MTKSEKNIHFLEYGITSCEDSEKEFIGNMKIAIFHNVPTGGAKRTVYEEIKILSKSNSVDLFQIIPQEEDFLNWSKLNCNIFSYQFSLNNSLPAFLNRLVKDFKNFFLLARLHRKIASDIDEKNYDIVIVHPDKFTQAPFLLSYLKTKNIYYCQELLRIAYEDQFNLPENIHPVKKNYELLTRKLRKIIDRQNARSAQIILANSNFTKQNILKAYNKTAEVCYLGVDAKIFKPLKSQRSILLFIGEPAYATGYPLVEELMRREDIKKKIEVKIIDFFDKKEKINDSDLAKEYSRAVAALCLSRLEPFGLIPLESMSCETPVIAIDEGGYKESVIEGKTGYLIERNSKALYTTVKNLLDNPSLIKKLGKEGRKNVEKNWTWEKHVSGLKKFF